MANVKMVGRVTDVNRSNGVAYVTLLDTEQGGMMKLSIPGADSVQIDQKLDLDVEVKPGIGKYGLYLKVVKVNKKSDSKD